MTQDQRAALEILLDAQNALDTDTQLMPLIRFVLFGTTGTIRETQKQSNSLPFSVEVRGDRISILCKECENEVWALDITQKEKLGLAIERAFDFEYCPNCYTSFVKPESYSIPLL